MPNGPKGEKRPANVIANAVRVARIATGEEQEELTDDGKDKAELKTLCEAGAYRPVIDSRYPLDRIREAHARADSGHKTGSVVVTLCDVR